VGLEHPASELGVGHGGHLLGERAAGDLAPHRVGEERVERAVEAEEEPDGPGRDLGPHVEPSSTAASRRFSSSRNWSGASGLWASENDIGRPDDRIISTQGAELVVEVEEVAHQLEHAGAGGADRLGDADQLLAGGGERRGVLAGARLVVAGAGRGEPERAGLHGLGHDPAHLGDLLGRGRLLVVGAPFAHDVQAHGGVGDLGGDVEVVGAGVDRVEEAGEVVPAPAQALGQRGAGDVLDALHQLDEALVVLVVHRREADAAVAHHHGGDAVPGRGVQPLVPRGLAVVVAVDVDEARA
jgi:hypothetical protein